MNKLLIIIFTIFISCEGNSQKNDAVKQEIALEKYFSGKNEEAFMENFPKTFGTFQSTFGWNEQKNAPEKLYKDSEKYIQYWFLLLNNPKYKKYENTIVKIAEEGKWEADAVSYFQDESIKFIKKNNRYDLINTLKGKNASSVLSFLFAGPVFNDDKDFYNHLSDSNKEIYQQISKSNVSGEKVRSSFSTYEENEKFTVNSFDIDKDGIPDKIVSSKPYEGSDLFVFLGSKNGDYKLNLETTNFSEDGGNVVRNIAPNSSGKGLIITTYFPDRGFYEKEITLAPENNSWFLKKIIYKTMSDNTQNAVKYICEVSQNIDITKSGWSSKINNMPAESERNKKCRTETQTLSSSKYYIQDSDGYTNLRKENNAKSPVLEKVKSGESVTVLKNTGDWFYIETFAGNKGFVHKSRLKN
ncbi:SH3 domain-containing protein [Chryseobacterium sp.]|uniref:SH3 domain-containing protein n=1 Tax=Chryseobacterium sp. TaxID=1871047 RepID=UPI00289AAEB4|nr:SH3 domain-containing protein [Chryseobacterium sp.]